MRFSAQRASELSPVTHSTILQAVWELIRKGILQKVRAGGALKQKVFNGAFGLKKSLGPKSVVSKVLDAAVFKVVKEATGGQLRYAVNGGAGISKDTQTFLQTALVPNFIQGYGELPCIWRIASETLILFATCSRYDGNHCVGAA